MILRIQFLAAAVLLVACSSGNGKGDGGANGDGGGPSCGDAACTASQVCVGTVTSGGAQICPQDGGTCPGSLVLDATTGCCYAVPSYTCAARPSGCGATVTCACASTLCASNHICSEQGGNAITCSLLAP